MEKKITQIERRFRRTKGLIIFLIFGIIIFIVKKTSLCFKSYEIFKEEFGRYSVLYIGSIVLLLILFFLYEIIDTIKNEQIESQKLKKIIQNKYGLTKNIFVELDIYNVPGMKKLKENGARFYARMFSEEEIELLVLNKAGNQVKREIIEDFVYFKEHYVRKQ